MTTLRDLKPTKKQNVKEITDELGLRMTNKYDWRFSDESGTYLIFEWLDDMLEKDGEIYFLDQATDWAEKNRSTALTVQINRAYAVASVILQAYYTKAPLNVAIIEGVRRVVGLRETSEAHLRQLDLQKWYPHHRDENGYIVVIRGKPQPDGFGAYEDDQRRAKLTGSPPPPPPSKTVELTRTAIYDRDPQVVKDVKRRAASGCCEFCGKLGFPTPQGTYYLEAHHVIPLNLDGADTVKNVIAICPDDHRRAHFGEDRHELRDRMIWDVLHKLYPDDTEYYEALDLQSAQIRKSEKGPTKLEDVRIDS
ncbi:HNH endonuclease [Paraburkholderia domus]|uniref:HNH endonuclease n=1 Tax=Paraburkholderia domus TaxID=2793075 RepID=UPI001B0B419D|nr:HNH endonuclease signature motif containing protein [Paraburkholderia domus]CAE6853555.1 hypothetical protein R75483_07716 [Paraburkholderia domus]